MLFKSSLTKEVSPWLFLSVKCPRPAAISAVAPTGSCPLPASPSAPSAVSPSCPTELARLAVPTMAVRSWLSRLSKAQCGKYEEGAAFLFAYAFSSLSQPWRPGPDGHCRYRKPCKLCEAQRSRRTWGKQPHWGRTASSWNHGAYRGGRWTLYT